jgi:hypothetical protein
MRSDGSAFLLFCPPSWGNRGEKVPFRCLEEADFRAFQRAL